MLSQAGAHHLPAPLGAVHAGDLQHRWARHAATQIMMSPCLPAIALPLPCCNQLQSPKGSWTGQRPSPAAVSFSCVPPISSHSTQVSHAGVRVPWTAVEGWLFAHLKPCTQFPGCARTTSSRQQPCIMCSPCLPAAAGMALPLCLDRLVNVAVALVLSTTAIVLFGECVILSPAALGVWFDLSYCSKRSAPEQLQCSQARC